MKKTLFITLAFFLFLTTFSQNPKNAKSLNSMPIIEKGAELHDAGEYEKAVQQFKKIPLGDSLYALAQYEMALTLYFQELYPNALTILEYLVDNPSKFVRSSTIYTLLGNVYMSMNEEEKAIDILDKAIFLTPYSFRLHITQGEAYLKLNQFEKAEKAMKEAIFCAPASQMAHRKLGEIYYKQHLVVPAILALNYAVYLNPKSEQAIEILQYIDKILVEIAEEVENRFNLEGLSENLKQEIERFNEIQNLLESQIALNKKYKNKSKIEHIIVYQSQLAFENLPNPKNSKDILDYLYIPFFKAIMEQNKFNTYTYYILSGTNLDNGKVEKKAKKMGKELQKFNDWGIDMLKEKIRWGLGKENNGDPKNEYEYDYEKGNLNAIGGYSKKNSSGRYIYSGNWITINSNGGIKSNLSLKNGKKDGVNIYYDNGYKLQLIPFKMDSIDGTAFAYFPTENDEPEKIEIEISFKNNKIQGVRKEFHRSGVLLEEGNYKDDLFHGDVKTYTKHGILKSITKYVDGEYDGLFQEFYPDGTVSLEIMYGKEDEEGFLKSYYPDGKIKKEGTVQNKQLVGTVKTYYPNGKIMSIGAYHMGGEPDGFWTDYYDNGNVTSEYSYENGELNGELKVYTRFGFLFGTQIFKKGKLVEVSTYLPNKEKRETIPFKNKSITVTFYNELGQKISTIDLNEKGEKHGTVIYYYPCGSIQSNSTYKNNLINGKSTKYYINGRIKEVAHFVDGEYDGLFIDYYENDTIKSEGYFTNGDQVGAWFFYNIIGELTTNTIYDEGWITYSVAYFDNGEKKVEEFYKNGFLNKEITYNHKKEIIAVDKFVDGTGIARTYYLNGNVQKEGLFRSNDYVDTVKLFDINGKETHSHYYLNGKLEGTFSFYGDVKSTQKEVIPFKQNKMHGVRSSYDENGVIYQTANYENGILSGEMKVNYYNGKLARTHSYSNGFREEYSNYYAIDGKTLTYRLKYQEDEIIAFAFMNKNNKMSEFIPITKDTQEVVAYYPNGQKSIEFKFLGGERVDKEILYYPNGKKFREVVYHNNQYHGKFSIYYNNGNVKETYTNYYDMLFGPYLEYYEDGTIKTDGNYYYDQPHGTFKYFDNKGVLIKEIEFYYGSIINQK